MKPRAASKRNHLLITTCFINKKTRVDLQAGKFQFVEFRGDFERFRSVPFENWIRLILVCPVQELDLSNCKLTGRRIFHSFSLVWAKLLDAKQGGLYLQKLNLSGNPIGLMDDEDAKVLTTSSSSLLKSSGEVFKGLMQLVMRSSVRYLNLNNTIVTAKHLQTIAKMLERHKDYDFKIDLCENPLYFSVGGKAINEFDISGFTALQALFRSETGERFLSLNISSPLTNIITDRPSTSLSGNITIHRMVLNKQIISTNPLDSFLPASGEITYRGLQEPAIYMLSPNFAVSIEQKKDQSLEQNKKRIETIKQYQKQLNVLFVTNQTRYESRKPQIITNLLSLGLPDSIAKMILNYSSKSNRFFTMSGHSKNSEAQKPSSKLNL